ncbi:MAG TPA: ATP synthase subunit I [Candidatus Acidoferrales bacterium]|nr:ATP synthase subunit I [Candidatus Acidoferrales bacterium]
MASADFFGVKAQQRVEYFTFALGAAGAVAALLLRGWPEAAALAVGAVVAWLNFRWLKQFVQWVTRISMAQAGEPKPRVPRRVYWQMFGRYALLAAVLYVMLLRFYWPVVAFLCGLFALAAAVLLELIGELVFFIR